jgi:hypothetical protein
MVRLGDWKVFVTPTAAVNDKSPDSKKVRRSGPGEVRIFPECVSLKNFWASIQGIEVRSAIL